MGMNSLPKTVTRQRRECDFNPGPSAPESSTLTTRLPSLIASDYKRRLFGECWHRICEAAGAWVLIAAAATLSGNIVCQHSRSDVRP